MSQVPPDYEPATDFSTLAATPILTLGLPGAQMDAENEAIATSLNATISRLSEIQRDDGQIRNGMVKLPTLAAEVLSLITASGGFNSRTWAPGESFYQNDLVSFPTSTGMEITGVLSPDASGRTYPAGESNGRTVWSTDGGLNGPSSSGTYVGIGWDDPGWRIQVRVNGVVQAGSFYSAEEVDSPDLVTSWTNEGGSTGTPVVEEFTSETAGTWFCIEDHLSSADFSEDISKWAFIAAPPQELLSQTVDSFTGDGVETDFELSVEPSSENNTQVYVAGLYQRKSTYSIAGTTLTFAVAPANAAAIEVVTGTSLETQAITLDDNSVTTAKLVDGAVTTSKIEDGAITAAKLATGAAVADDSITSVKLQNNSVTTDKIAAGAVTEGKLATGAISESKLATGAVSASKMGAAAVTTSKLADENVTAAKLAADAVETAKIKDANVTEAKLATDAVTNLKILAGTIAFDRLNSSSLEDGLRGINGIPKVNVRFVISGGTIVGTATNVAGITNTGTGKYRVDFTSALANADYIPQVSLGGYDGGAATRRYAGVESSADCTTTSCTISLRRTDTTNLTVPAGSEFLSLTIY